MRRFMIAAIAAAVCALQAGAVTAAPAKGGKTALHIGTAANDSMSFLATSDSYSFNPIVRISPPTRRIPEEAFANPAAWCAKVRFIALNGLESEEVITFTTDNGSIRCPAHGDPVVTRAPVSKP